MGWVENWEADATSGKFQFAVAAVVVAMALALAGCAQAGNHENRATSDASGQGGSPSVASGTGAPAEAASDVRSYTVSRVDGDIDWGNVAQLDIDNAQWADAYGILAHAQLCYDDRALYVHMWAEESDIRAEHQRDELCPSCYEDSCLEFFISPIEGDARYMNFEFNSNCAVCAEIGTQKMGRVALVPKDDVYNASSNRIEDGREIFFELPFDYLRYFYPEFQAQPGTQIRANFYKCGNLTEHKHYLSWNPIDSDTPNFHVPACFGIIAFE